MDIILLVLIISGLIGIINYTGAFNVGISSLANKFQGREKWIIIMVTTFISIGYFIVIQKF